MPTVAADQVSRVFFPLPGTITVTPSAQARVTVDDRESGGAVGRIISSAQNFSTDAGGAITIEAIGGSVTHTDEPFTAAQVSATQALVSADGIFVVNSRDGLGRVTSYTDNSGTTYTVTYGSFGPATISGGGKTRTYSYNVQGLCTGYTGA